MYSRLAGGHVEWSVKCVSIYLSGNEQLRKRSQSLMVKGYSKL